MATPSENVAQLNSFWAAVAVSDAELAQLAHAAPLQALAIIAKYGDVAARVHYAQLTMAQLVDQARVGIPARQVFASSSIFAQALLTRDGLTDYVLAGARTASQPTAISSTPSSYRWKPPRLIMIDGIYQAATEGVFIVNDPSGLTTWMRSPLVDGPAIRNAILHDPNPAVRATMLRILRDAAIPEATARLIVADRLLDALVEGLASSSFDQGTRATLQTLGTEAYARIQRDLARLPDLGSLPTFSGGDGGMYATLPPAIAAWRKPGPWIAGGVGLAAGGLAASRRRTR